MVVFGSDRNSRRNDELLQALFESHYEFVFRMSYSILLDQDMARDATQEAFSKAFARIDTLKDKSKFNAWVCTIATNVCRDMLREKIIYRSRNIAIYDDDGSEREYLQALREPDIAAETYEETESRNAVRKCIAELEPDVRRIINLRYVKDMTYKDISESTGMSEGTIRSIVCRAKEKIRKTLPDLDQEWRMRS